MIARVLAALKKKPNSTRGCPCKGRDIVCSEECHCGTRAKPCQNKVKQSKLFYVYTFAYIAGFILNKLSDFGVGNGR